MKARDIAQDIFDRVLTGEYEPVGWEIERDYDISGPTASKVKRLVKEMFGEAGSVWGYDPQFTKFVLAPSTNCPQRRRVIEYAIDHASTAASSIRFQIRGAQASGSVTEASGDTARDTLDRGASIISSAADQLAWNDLRQAG